MTFTFSLLVTAFCLLNDRPRQFTTLTPVVRRQPGSDLYEIEIPSDKGAVLAMERAWPVSS